MKDKGIALGCITLAICLCGSAVLSVVSDKWTAKHNPQSLFVSLYFDAVNRGDYAGAVQLLCPTVRDTLAQGTYADVQEVKDSGSPIVYQIEDLERLTFPGPISETRASIVVTVIPPVSPARRERIASRESILESCIAEIEVISLDETNTSQ
jgi:hypothetical protein